MVLDGLNRATQGIETIKDTSARELDNLKPKVAALMPRKRKKGGAWRMATDGVEKIKDVALGGYNYLKPELGTLARECKKGKGAIVIAAAVGVMTLAYVIVIISGESPLTDPM